MSAGALAAIAYALIGLAVAVGVLVWLTANFSRRPDLADGIALAISGLLAAVFWPLVMIGLAVMVVARAVYDSSTDATG